MAMIILFCLVSIKLLLPNSFPQENNFYILMEK